MGNIFARGLKRTRETWFRQVISLFERSTLDAAVWDELEELLIGADVGVDTALKLIAQTRERVAGADASDGGAVKAALQARIDRGEISETQASIRKPPEAEDNATIVVWLASDAAANINGQVFFSRGGLLELCYHPMPGPKDIYKDGRWTLDELDSIMPGTLAAGLVNPAPPQPPKE